MNNSANNPKIGINRSVRTVKSKNNHMISSDFVYLGSRRADEAYFFEQFKT